MSGQKERWRAEPILKQLAVSPGNQRELTEKLNILPSQAGRALYFLKTCGFVKLVDGRWRLTEKGKKKQESGGRIRGGAPGQPRTMRTFSKPSFRSRAWSLLREVKKSTVPDLLSILEPENEKGAEDNLTRYFGALERAGYVTRLRHRRPGVEPTSNGRTVWFLPRGKKEGPKAPLWRRKEKTVFDPNTGQEIHLSPKGGKPCSVS